MNPYLKRFLPLVDFLAEVLGKDSEIILHDVHEPGSPATNLLLKVLEEGKFIEKDFITNYRGFSASSKTLKSSAYLIRDNERKVVGLLCVNIDNGKFIQFKSYLDSMIQLPPEGNERNIVERFDQTIETAIAKVGISPGRMSCAEKITIVKNLNADGVFSLKGAVGKVASKLKVSEATMYRYIKKAKRSNTL